MEFTLVGMFHHGVKRATVRSMFEYMDRIDSLRNAVLELINPAPYQSSGLIERITLSSELLKRSAEMDEQGRTYEWDNYYLRCHQEITEFLAGED